MTVLRSKDNPTVKRWARLATDARFRRKERRALIEGPHLVAACLERGLIPVALLLPEGQPNQEIQGLLKRFRGKPTVLSASVFGAILDAETPQGVAAEIEIPRASEREGQGVYLEGIQDPGNVGAIIRSAAAFGVRTIYYDDKCADPWSPKVLRAGAGGHFQLNLIQGEPPQGARLACAVVRGGTPLAGADLSGPLCWVFGSEGKGASQEMQRKAALRVTVPILPGTESLNVAAAAAICLHAAFSKRAGGS